MSLVGTRPILPDFLYYLEADYGIRFCVFSEILWVT